MSKTRHGLVDDLGRLYGGESLSERTARRRQQFLDAGLQVFGTTGYRTATVRQLCRQAELTDRYFYESFEHTEDLLMAVYRQQFDKIQQTIVAALLHKTPAGDAMEAVHAGLKALYSAVDDPRVARVCWLEVLGVSPKVDAMYHQTFEQFSDLIVGFARSYIPTWSLDEEETRLLGMALVGAVSQLVTHQVLGGHRDSHDARVAATARVFRGVMATLRP